MRVAEGCLGIAPIARVVKPEVGRFVAKGDEFGFVVSGAIGELGIADRVDFQIFGTRKKIVDSAKNGQASLIRFLECD